MRWVTFAQGNSSLKWCLWEAVAGAPAAVIRGGRAGDGGNIEIKARIFRNFETDLGSSGFCYSDSVDTVAYQYKLGLSGSTNCSDSNGYSIAIDVGTKITDDISDLGDGDIKLCILGRDEAGNIQDYSSATELTWTQDSYPATNFKSTACRILGDH